MEIRNGKKGLGGDFSTEEGNGWQSEKTLRRSSRCSQLK